MSELVVSELAIYPVKSLAQVPLQSSEVHRFGLAYDRRWMIVDVNGGFLSQRKFPRMCLIKAQLIPSLLNPVAIQLSAPEMNPLEVAIPDGHSLRQVTVWKDTCTAYDCGNPVADWLSYFLATECRLVFFPESEVRAVDPNYALPGDQTAFSDGFPLLLIGQASLDDLNQRLPTPVSMRRFRPNIVISGSEAFAEDHWQAIQIGDIRFRVVKPCSRCSIPAIDPDNAHSQPELLHTLSLYRKKGNQVFFGQNVIADGTGHISVGMPVQIL